MSKSTTIETKTIETESKKITPWTYQGYGVNLPSIFSALMELVRNAIDAVLENDKYNRKIDIQYRDGYITIQDNGYGFSVAELFRAFDYSLSSHRGKNNVMGAGFEMAVSKCNPSNDAWAVYSRNASVEKAGFTYISAEAPYTEEMTIFKHKDNWPEEFKPWANTVIKVKVENPDANNNDIFSLLELNTTMAISEELYNVNIHYNNVQLRPAVPSLEREVVSTKVTYEGHVNIVTAYNFFLSENATYPFWAPKEENQGVWVFADGTLMEHVGMSCISKKSSGKFDSMSDKCKKNHPSLNRCVTFIHIEHSSSEPRLRLPVEATKNCINFEEGYGPMYREAINLLSGDWFRSCLKAKEESMRLLYERVIGRVIGKEVHASEVYVDSTKDYRLDYVAWKLNDEDDAKFVQNIISEYERKNYLVLNNDIANSDIKISDLFEFKGNKIPKPEEVAKVGLYVKRFRDEYGYTPEAVYIIAKDFNRACYEALEQANHFLRRKSSPLIKFAKISDFISDDELSEYFK